MKGSGSETGEGGMDGGDSHSSSSVGAAGGEQNSMQWWTETPPLSDFLLLLQDLCSQVAGYFLYLSLYIFIYNKLMII